MVFGGPAEDFTKEIRPILERHCYDCHGSQKQKGDLNLATFEDYEQVKAASERWQLVLQRVQAFEMPPEGKYELNYDKHQTLMRWLRKLPRPEEVNCDQLASDRTTSFYEGYVMSRRLNRAEYSRTVRDLLGVDLHLEELLPADGGGGEGFDTSGNALFLSTIHIEKYLGAAERIVRSILPDDPSTISSSFTQARDRILVSKPDSVKTPREAAREVVMAFARRAFRRPVTEGEVSKMLTLFDRAWSRGDNYETSLRLPLKGILISPNFLFLAEPESGEDGVQPLHPVPLASRLSYFIWSSMPDEELLCLAENGELLDPRVYRHQIYRMLADPKAEALGERFALQWLDLERLGGEIRPDAKRFPEFDEELSAAMKDEVTQFFNHLVRGDGSLLDLIDSEYTFVNKRLGELYGLDETPSSGMTRVSLPDRTRGGILGMAAVHARTSFPTRTSPVLRGHWILEALLGERVPPPPPDVPALETAAADAGQLSLREQLEKHRSKSECASCHNKMDPLGFGLENFDVLGRWREQDRGLPIDAAGTLPSGEKFTGPTGLKTVLLERKDAIMKHLVRKMTGFAYGRELNRFDNCAVNRTLEALQANEYRAIVMIEQIATSFPFRHRFYPKQKED